MERKLDDRELQRVVNNVEKWMDLLDQDIAQTQGVLKRPASYDGPESYCCLGLGGDRVLHLSQENGIAEVAGSTYQSVYFQSIDGDLTVGELPGLSYLMLGLKSRVGSRSGDGYVLGKLHSLADMNDHLMMTFKEIRERLLVDLRTGAFGFFLDEVQQEWRRRHGFTESPA